MFSFLPSIFVWSFLFVLVSAQQRCFLQENCDGCISTGIECMWCSDSQLSNTTSSRCIPNDDSYECNNPQNPLGNITIVEDLPFSQLVQVRPQRIKIRLRPGESVTFNATVKPALNFPLDLYYLMDLSYSMRDDLDNLKRLSSDIANQINNISTDSQLGFGSFVDKPLSPYISTTPARINDPCNDQCQPAYSFHHVLNLTTNAEQFRTLVDNTRISGNLDVPEGSFDALLQAIVCTNFIGWRQRARHLLLMATDADFHAAGDGKLGGVVRPHDGNCYLDRISDQLYAYTHSNEFDYPSVYQINDYLVMNDIVALFAVTNRAEYDRLVSNETQRGPIDNLYIGVLAEDSSNVVQLIDNAYRSIAETIQIRNGTNANVRVIANATCPFQTADGQCTEVTIGNEATYDISVQLLDCTESLFDTSLRFVFYGDILIEIEPICGCECTSQPSFVDTFCSNETLRCGQCECNGRQGSRCECPSSQNTFDNNELCRRSNNSEVLCSNRGSCLCGKCICEIQQNPDDRVYGQFCECDNFNCPRDADNICGGLAQGICECGECICVRHPNGLLWTRGPTGVCDCTPDQEPCRAANGQICAGNGNCMCGRCSCPPEYTISSNCLSCNDPMACNALCMNYYECVTCYRRGQDNCRCGNETNIPVIFINETISGTYFIEGVQGTPCLVTIDGCSTSFSVAVDRMGNIKPIHIQSNPICPSSFSLWYIPPLAVLFALIVVLVIVLIVIKLILVFLDIREYKEFTKNLHLDTQNMNENPLYKKEAAEIGNPIYNQVQKPPNVPLF